VKVSFDPPSPSIPENTSPIEQPQMKSKSPTAARAEDEAGAGDGGTRVVYGSGRDSDLEDENVRWWVRRFHYLQMNEGGRWRVVKH